MITFFAFLKNNKWFITLITILLIFLSGSYFGAKLFRTALKKMENNFIASMEAQQDSTARAYELKLQEVKQYFPELQKQISADMDIKLKRVEAIQNVNTVTNTTVNTVVRDSVINDTLSAKVATYKDEWTDFKLTMIENQVSARIQTKDSLLIVVHRVPRGLWGWLKGQPKEVRSDVQNYNPNSKVVYNRMIKIQK